MNCQKCGNEIYENSQFCENCGQPTQAALDMIPEKKENVLLGIIGALIGALLGGASIILFSQLGYVASLSGVILAFCTLLGYNLLGRKLSGFGIVFCIILMVITPYLADRLDWAIVVMKSFGEISLLDSFILVPELIKDGSIEKVSYLYTLGKLYLFVAIGGVGTFISRAKKQK